MSSVMLISGIVCMVSVLILGLAAFYASGARGGLSVDSNVFKTGNPALGGELSTQGQVPAPTEPPAALELDDRPPRAPTMIQRPAGLRELQREGRS